MALILGASAYAFSVMLFSFLLGIGGGGWLGGPLADKLYAKGELKHVLKGLAVLQVGIAFLTWAAMYMYAELPWLFVVVYDVVGEPLMLWIGKLLLAMSVMVPPALLMGCTFLSWFARQRASPGARQACRSSVDGTVGAIFGAGLGGLVLLPWLFVRAPSCSPSGSTSALPRSPGPSPRMERVHTA